MAAPWPDIDVLPNVPETWSESDRPTLIRTEMETGPAKVRRRFTAIMREIHLSMTMRWDQFTALRDFFDQDLQQGTEFHSFVHPYTLATEQFRFVEPPQLSSAGALVCTVSMVWEQIPT